ncbi:BRO-N domain-containing protein [Agrobacterium tumefaciens]|uniref:BRO-N domain-containing protein n=2 Tax=Agrobacterium TaxID=357 RepID=UPI00045AA78E|nr:BRO family protein [Agrobacterium tumefaciens]CDN92000.1 Prophage antirepressor protein [Agrobacterium tumefaciens]
MQYAMQVFEYENNDQFNVIERGGEPWFMLNEVCKKVDIANPADAASRLDDDEKDTIGITDSIGRPRRAIIINESGLYSIILRSTKPEAKRFKKWITSEVLPTIRKTGGYHGKMPAFIRRYNANWDRVSPGYFSVISELVIRLWGRLEMVGHTMRDIAPDGKQLRPDTSVGLLFSKWLKANHPTVCDNYGMYMHVTDEWEGEARQYPIGMLPLFIEFVDTVWIPEHAERYFNTRDPAALPHLPRLIAGTNFKAIPAA